MGIEDEQRQLDAARQALVEEFSGRLSPDEVSARFSEILADFEGSPIRGFVPVLAQRQARQRLRALSS